MPHFPFMSALAYFNVQHTSHPPASNFTLHTSHAPRSTTTTKVSMLLYEEVAGFVNTSELLTGFVNTSELLKDAP